MLLNQQLRADEPRVFEGFLPDDVGFHRQAVVHEFKESITEIKRVWLFWNRENRPFSQ